MNNLQCQVDENGLVHTSDRNFGYMAQRSLECAYKAVLGSHGIEYPPVDDRATTSADSSN